MFDWMTRVPAGETRLMRTPARTVSGLLKAPEPSRSKNAPALIVLVAPTPVASESPALPQAQAAREDETANPARRRRRMISTPAGARRE